MSCMHVDVVVIRDMWCVHACMVVLMLCLQSSVLVVIATPPAPCCGCVRSICVNITNIYCHFV